MVPIAVAISLTHQSFGAVILPFHKAIGKACWQKLEKRENFVPPVFGSGSLEKDSPVLIVAMKKEEQTRLVHHRRLGKR